MGHGASTRTNVKNISIQNGVLVSKPTAAEPCKTPRSSSDGCIVETLNSSKCRAELLEIQVDEYKELLRLKECKQVETQDRATLLEAQLSEVEGKNFELTDRISELEQQLEGLQQNTTDAPRPIPEVEEDELARLEQQLESKELNIEKLEDQVNTLEADLKKMRSKFKKRLKAAQTETAEVRQESALKVYSLKDEIKKLEEENTKLIARLDRASSATRSRQGSAGVPNVRAQQTIEEKEEQLDDWKDGRTKLIVELSNQVSSQEELVSDLRKQLEEKETKLKEFQLNGRGSHPLSGQSRSSSAKKDRTAPVQKSYWGYADTDSRITEPSGNNLEWSPKSADDDENGLDKPRLISSREQNWKSSTESRKLFVTQSPDDEDGALVIPRKSSSREQSRKSSAGSRRSYNEEADPESNIKQNQRLKVRTGSGSKKSSRNSSAVSRDSVLSENSDDARSRNSSARKSLAGSSRQRRRLQAAVDESSRYSPHQTESALSNTSAISRTKDGKDSGIDIHSASYQSDLILDGNDNVDKLMHEIVGFPSYDSDM